jgi:hypothetical protein
MLFTAYRLAICITVAVFVALAPLAQAQDFSAADKAALKSYAIDAAKVNRYITALNALAMARASDSAIADEYEQMDSEPGESLTELKAKIARHPRIFAFFQRQTLTVDDSVMIPFVVTLTGVAVAVPGQMTDMISPAQLNFYKANGPLMQRLEEANEALDNAAP